MNIFITDNQFSVPTSTLACSDLYIEIEGDTFSITKNRYFREETAIEVERLNEIVNKFINHHQGRIKISENYNLQPELLLK